MDVTVYIIKMNAIKVVMLMICFLVLLSLRIASLDISNQMVVLVQINRKR